MHSASYGAVFLILILGTVFPGAASLGKLAFTLADDVDTQSLGQRLRALHSVQGLMALVATASHLARERSALAQLGESLSRSKRWRAAIKAWRDFAPELRRPAAEVGAPTVEGAPTSEAADGASSDHLGASRYAPRDGPRDGPRYAPRDGPRSFRASCVRDGKHSFNSVAVAEALGTSVSALFGWPVSMRAFQLELSAFVTQSTAVIGIMLSERGNLRHSGLPAEPRPLMPYCSTIGRLRSTTAYLMLKLAHPKPGEVLIDPMCGVGTVPLEASAVWPALHVLGGDAHARSAAQAAANSAALAEARRRAASEAMATLPLAQVPLTPYSPPLAPH